MTKIKRWTFLRTDWETLLSVQVHIVLMPISNVCIYIHVLHVSEIPSICLLYIVIWAHLEFFMLSNEKACLEILLLLFVVMNGKTEHSESQQTLQSRKPDCRPFWGCEQGLKELF